MMDPRTAEIWRAWGHRASFDELRAFTGQVASCSLGRSPGLQATLPEITVYGDVHIHRDDPDEEF